VSPGVLIARRVDWRPYGRLRSTTTPTRFRSVRALQGGRVRHCVAIGRSGTASRGIACGVPLSRSVVIGNDLDRQEHRRREPRRGRRSICPGPGARRYRRNGASSVFRQHSVHDQHGDRHHEHARHPRHFAGKPHDEHDRANAMPVRRARACCDREGHPPFECVICTDRPVVFADRLSDRSTGSHSGRIARRGAARRSYRCAARP